MGLRLWAIFVLTFIFPGAYGEDVLSKARELAASKQRPEALHLLEGRLAKAPQDVDARLLYGLILSWEGRYDEARDQLGRVLIQSPGYRDARIALVNVELWSDHPARAEQLAREGLLKNPGDEDLLFAEARALRAQGRNAEAASTLTELLRIDPANVKARQLRETVRDNLRPWTVSFDYSEDRFGESISPWHEYQLQLKRATPFGPVLGRIQRADRFGLHGNQAELDFYPQIRPGTYAYLNVGFSPDSALYPSYRAGFDLYQALGHGYEASAGFRRLGFKSPVSIYTLWLGKYYGNWLFGGRAFLTPDALGTSASVYLSARRYFGDLGDYVGFQIGRGSTPIEISNVTDLAILNSTSGQLEFFRTFNRRLMFGVRTGLSRENRLGRGTTTRYQLNPSIALRF